MYALNQTLEKHIAEADGRYLSSLELQPLEDYFRTYKGRLETYRNLSEESDKLVLEALRKLARLHPELIQKHGQRCRYDMTEVLRYIGLSILRDDEAFFQDKMMVWLDTILRAFKRNAQCTAAYQYLQEVVDEQLPSTSSNMIRPYLELVITSIQPHT